MVEAAWESESTKVAAAEPRLRASIPRAPAAGEKIENAGVGNGVAETGKNGGSHLVHGRPRGAGWGEEGDASG